MEGMTAGADPGIFDGGRGGVQTSLSMLKLFYNNNFYPISIKRHFASHSIASTSSTFLF